MVLCILTFTFLESRTTKDSETNDSKHSPNLVCS
jgi:hypothetical protein